LCLPRRSNCRQENASHEEVTAFLPNAGFHTLTFRQTIFRDPGGMDAVDPVREGRGDGCFVVVRVDK